MGGKIEHKRFRPEQMKVIRPKAGARDSASSASGPRPEDDSQAEDDEDAALAAKMMEDD